MQEEARRLRLEEIFAEEPHLSPTMKAQRLHEKMQGAKGEVRFLPVVPPLPQNGAAKMSLREAGERLRTGADWNALTHNAANTRLFRFRDTTLRQWLTDAPEIRILGAGEGSGDGR